MDQLRAGLFKPIIKLLNYAEKSEQFSSSPETKVLDESTLLLREGHPKLFHDHPKDSAEFTAVGFTSISSMDGVNLISAETILWHSFLAFVACFGPSGYAKQKIESEEVTFTEHESLSDWLYVASVHHFLPDAHIRAPLRIASLLIQCYGFKQLQLPCFRMFWFANWDNDIAEPWGPNPRH